jgi:hypothetical protein
MKSIISTLLILIIPWLLYAQKNEVEVKNAQTININKNAGATINTAQTVIIKDGNFRIGTLIINEDANNSDLYIDTIYQVRDTFGLWHVIAYLKTINGQPITKTKIALQFSNPIINKIGGTSGMFVGVDGVDSTKTTYRLIGTHTTLQNSVKLTFNSEKKQMVKIYGVLPKKN